MSDKWNNRFIKLAEHVSEWSKQGHKIGAVITNTKNEVISLGYNGFPSGIEDDKRLENKELRREMCIHAEQNCILHAKQDLTNCKIYIYGYCCCSKCALLIIQSGIKEVYYKNIPNKKTSEYWEKDLAFAKDLLKEAKILVKEIK